MSEAVWSQLVTDWQAADRKLNDARLRYDAIPLPDKLQTAEEAAYDEAWDAAEACADRLLGVEAPDAAGAALQVRLFALRFHSVDLADPPRGPESEEVQPLRRIYAALTR